MKKIDVQMGKSLHLKNVLIRDIINSNGAEDIQEDICSIDLEVEKMKNEIKLKGAMPIGPLIQYSDAKRNNDSIEIAVSLMLQSDAYISSIYNPYHMEPVIKVNNCMYTRFSGMEEDIQFAYQKLAVTAYEEDIKLKGSSYTIFLDSDDSGNITADIFMERIDA